PTVHRIADIAEGRSSSRAHRHLPGDEVGIGVDGDSVPTVPDTNLEVEVRGGALGVAGVAHPSDQLTGRHGVGDAAAVPLAARCDVGGDDVVGDSLPKAVIRSRRVVVEVQVAGLPAAVVDD